MSKFYMPKALKGFFEAGVGKDLPQKDYQEIVKILNKPLTREQRENNLRVLQDQFLGGDIPIVAV